MAVYEQTVQDARNSGPWQTLHLTQPITISLSRDWTADGLLILRIIHVAQSQLEDMPDYDHPFCARPTMPHRQRFHVRKDNSQHVRQYAGCSRYAMPLCFSYVRLGSITIKLLSSFMRSTRPVCSILAAAEELLHKFHRISSEHTEDGRYR